MDDLLLLFLLKTIFPSWVWPIITAFLCKLGPKKQFLRGFTHFFSELLHCNTSYYLILIVSPNIFHWKSAKKTKVGVVFVGQNLGQIKSNVVKKNKLVFQWFFFIFCMRYTFIYKQKGSGYRNT